AVLLDRPQARIFRRAHVAAVAASRSHPARRGLREEMGRARRRHRPLLRTVACRCAAGRRDFRNAVLAIPDRQFRLGIPVGGRADRARWRRRQGLRLDFLNNKPPGIAARRLASHRCYFSAAAPACEIVSSCEPVPPETPTAPMMWPLTTSGLPPREPVKVSPSVGR